MIVLLLKVIKYLSDLIVIWYIQYKSELFFVYLFILLYKYNKKTENCNDQ